MGAELARFGMMDERRKVGLNARARCRKAKEEEWRGMESWRRVPRNWVFILALGLLLTGRSAQTEVKKHITCEDGEEFTLEEQLPADSMSTPLASSDKIIIDTKRLRLEFYRDNVLVRTYPVAIGASDTPTPVGEWMIIHKGGNWGDGFGARWLGINVPWGIYGIHGTNKPYSIGSGVSHGCVRMFNPHVVELYSMVKIGTPVYIYGDLPRVHPRPEVGRNNTGRDVLVMQYRLRQLGFDPGRADGRFGEPMERAVKRLQYYYGLTPTGRVAMVEQYLLGLR